jgi:hypothetical protein
VLVLSGGEYVDGAGSGREGKYFCFCFVKVDPEWWAEVNEELDEESKVFVGEERAGVVDEGGGGGAGAESVVIEIAGSTAVFGVLF